ncbi:MAG: low-specificity L-threonine aldolase [Gemmataceae bacterium]
MSNDAAIDLRSDTVTRPTPAMKAAMMAAPLGDDVFNEDPTVRKLEAHVAELLGKAAALFVPSGTMSNQIGIKAHTQPGDEMLCDVNCHIYNYEAGGPAVLSGVTARTLEGQHGILDLSQLEDKVRPINEHFTRTRLVCLENTHNRGGGRIYPLEKIQAIRAWTREQHLILHLDGARLWNAVVATGIPPRTWAAEFDTVSVCFSKGLGAPVGSALAGPVEFIQRARHIRKLLGGGMRQAGILAAAALHALNHHVDRLVEDHRHAQLIAAAIRETPGLRLVPADVQTNLIWFEIERGRGTARDLSQRLDEMGVKVHPAGPQLLRACTHLDVTTDQAHRVAEVFPRALAQCRTTPTR